MNLDESKESSDDALKQKLVKKTFIFFLLYNNIISKNINSVAAKNELNLLASLIKGTEQNKNEQTLKLNLFPNTRLKNPSHDNFQQSNDYDNDIIIIGLIEFLQLYIYI